MKVFKGSVWFVSVVLFFFAVVFLKGCGSSTDEIEDGGEATTFSLASNDITNGGTVGDTYVYNQEGCTGSNQSPQLSWSNPPDNTLSYAITVLDSDANNWVHWIIYDIPSATASLERGASAPTGATEVTNGYGNAGYGGPCPPTDETHDYVFKVWAMSVENLADTGSDISTNAKILTALEANDLDSATITVSYTGP